jgi:hypothetical protein
MRIGYIDAGKKGLTGGFGTIWPNRGMNEIPLMGEAPKMIPIIYNGKPYLEMPKAFRISKDGAMAAFVTR